MLNAKPFQMTATERARCIEHARWSTTVYDVPHAIFYDTAGIARIEPWRGQKFGGGLVIVVIPSWVEIAA